MSNTTSINLGDHFTNFLGELTDSGRYGSVSEAVRSALRLLELEEAKMDFLHGALIEGEDSGESARSFSDIIKEAKMDIHAE